MFKVAVALLLAIVTAAAQPIPKKYDPETLKYMQGVIDSMRSEVAALRADVKEIRDNSRRVMQPTQVIQKLNATALSEKALEARVDGLDITIDSGKLSALIAAFAADKAERDHRAEESRANWDTAFKLIQGICVGIIGLIGIGFKAWLSGRKMKTVVDEVKVQTNGNLDKVRSERDEAMAQLATYRNRH